MVCVWNGRSTLATYRGAVRNPLRNCMACDDVPPQGVPNQARGRLLERVVIHPCGTSGLLRGPSLVPLVTVLVPFLKAARLCGYFIPLRLRFRCKSVGIQYKHGMSATLRKWMCARRGDA